MLITILTIILILLYSSWIVLFLLPSKKRNADFLYKPLSIIIPAHNEEKCIESTIKSVLAANYPTKEREIIVVNDGSTDKTEEIVRSIAKGNKSVRLIQGLHQGKGKAVNLAVKHSKYDFMAVLDADTEIEKDSLIHLLKAFSDKSVGAASSVIRVKKSPNILNWFQQLEYPISNAGRYVVDKINGTCDAPGFCAFKKEAFLSIGGFHADCATEDYDMCVRMQKAGYKIKMAPKAIAYTEVPATISGFMRQKARWSRGRFQTIKKNKDLLFKRNAVGLYSFPTQLYWFIHAFLYVPAIVYQIIDGYFKYFFSVGNALSYNVFMYFFKWLTIFGMGDFMYNILTGVYPYTTLNILTIAVFLLSYTFSIFSLIKFSKKSTYQILFAIMFFFPYSISLLSINIYSVFYETFSLSRGEKWEKVK